MYHFVSGLVIQGAGLLDSDLDTCALFYGAHRLIHGLNSCPIELLSFYLLVFYLIQLLLLHYARYYFGEAF